MFWEECQIPYFKLVCKIWQENVKLVKMNVRYECSCIFLALAFFFSLVVVVALLKAELSQPLYKLSESLLNSNGKSCKNVPLYLDVFQ